MYCVSIRCTREHSLPNLKPEFDYYVTNQAASVAAHRGKFVVIKDQKVIGAYGSELEAVGKPPRPTNRARSWFRNVSRRRKLHAKLPLSGGLCVINPQVTRISFAGVVDALRANIMVGAAYAAPEKPPQQLQFLGIWDTGATNSVITERVVNALGLKTIGITRIQNTQGFAFPNTYLISLCLPEGNVRFPNLRATEGKMVGFDVLIGMDMISQGDLLITE